MIELQSYSNIYISFLCISFETFYLFHILSLPYLTATIIMESLNKTTIWKYENHTKYA